MSAESLFPWYLISITPIFSLIFSHSHYMSSGTKCTAPPQVSAESLFPWYSSSIATVFSLMFSHSDHMAKRIYQIVSHILQLMTATVFYLVFHSLTCRVIASQCFLRAHCELICCCGVLCGMFNNAAYRLQSSMWAVCVQYIYDHNSIIIRQTCQSYPN